MDGWRLPGWDYCIWREGDIDNLGLVNRRIYDHYLKHEKWPGAVNVARVEILAQHGGVYIDADTRMLRPIDDAPFMNASTWIVRTPGTNRLNNAMMGCAPGSPVMMAYRDAISRVAPWWRPLFRHSLLPPPRVTGGWLLTRVVEDFDVEWVDAGAFTLYDKHGHPIDYNGPVYGDHRWGSTSGLWRPSREDGNGLRKFLARSTMLRRIYHQLRGAKP